MSEKMKAQAREILDQYLESNLHRKTSEDMLSLMLSSA